MTSFQIPLRASQLFGIALAVVATLGATLANANTISYSTSTPYADGSTIKGETMQFGTRAASTVYGGALTATESSVTGSFWVYCLDPMVYAVSGVSDTPSGLSAFLGSSAYFGSAAYAAPALAPYGKQDSNVVRDALVELYSHAYYDSLTSSTKSAAFQYTVWEILGEAPSGYGTNSGALQSPGNTDAAFVAQANAYLTAMTASNETAGWTAVSGTGANGATNLGGASTFTYTVYSPQPTGSSQAFLRVTPSNVTNTNTVPEPNTGVLALVAGLAFAGSRKLAAKRPRR